MGLTIPSSAPVANKESSNGEKSKSVTKPAARVKNNQCFLFTCLGFPTAMNYSHPSQNTWDREAINEEEEDTTTGWLSSLTLLVAIVSHAISWITML